MKNLNTILSSALCAAIVGTAAVASAQTHPGYATVVRVQGIANYSNGGGKWHPLLAGKVLPAGSTIQSCDNGTVDVVLGKAVEFPQSKLQPDRISPAADAPVRGLVGSKPSIDQNVVRLTHDTTLGIDKLTTTDTGADTVGDTVLDLQQGKIFASVKKLSAASEYSVKFPNGVAGVRGTKFSLSVDGALADYKTETEGVNLTVNGHDPLVPQGQEFNPATGTVGPIPTGENRTLSDTFTALNTLYFEATDFDFDNTGGYVSPTTGHH